MSPYFESILEVLEDSIKNINEERFNELIDDCVRTLNNNHKIVASGLGKNVPICDKFVGTMLSLGLNAAFLHTNSAVHGDLGIVQKDDLVILLTKSGETVESIYLAEHLINKGANVWLLTFNKDSTLTNMCPKALVLKLKHECDDWNLVPNNSTTMNLILLQAVAINVARRMGVTLDQFKVNHPGGAIGAKLRNV